MADVISKSQVLGSTGNIMQACPSSSSKKSGVSSVGFPHLPFPTTSSSGFDTLRSPSSGRNNTMQPVPAQMSYTIGKAMRWWEKGLQPNIREVESANDLVDSLLNAGNKLVVVDFFSPGCGGCRALHPKICQLAEMNPEVLFLQVNFEEHKSMCYSLNVHVLPFFRFYRGSKGRLCSFSCTNATIKKFKDAMAKHNTQSCSDEPPKGFEESELMALASNRDLDFHYTGNPEPATTVSEEEHKVSSNTNHAPVPEEKNDLLTASR